MGTVTKRINITISDEDINTVLQRIADNIGHIIVISGDRGKALTIGAKNKSLHLHNQAADFRFGSISLEEGYKQLKEKKSLIFSKDKKYEIIHHGEHTNTHNAHLHVGRYPSGTGTFFKLEGLTAKTRGKYIFDND
jgi:hypothetical protein